MPLLTIKPLEWRQMSAVNGDIPTEVNDNAPKACNEAIAKSWVSRTSLNGHILDLHGSRILQIRHRSLWYIR
jgi:hypothetical protein